MGNKNIYQKRKKILKTAPNKPKRMATPAMRERREIDRSSHSSRLIIQTHDSIGHRQLIERYLNQFHQNLLSQ